MGRIVERLVFGLWSLAFGLRPLAFGLWLSAFGLRLIGNEDFQRPKAKGRRPNFNWQLAIFSLILRA
jgi:hypothetical protein